MFYAGPAVIVPVCLFAISLHPDPVDNCPCFEDAIAFVSVALGVALGQWHVHQRPFEAAVATRGILSIHEPLGFVLWVAASLSKLMLGITCILMWRLAAKTMLYFVLPPIFKTFKPIIDLPRRFYVPARRAFIYKFSDEVC